MSVSLSLPEPRRLAIASQGFGPKPATPTVRHLRTLAARLYAFQIDSVNVLVRAHYVPAFARLGPYPMDALDTLVHRKRELFEYWGHAACLLPLSLYPLLRYRMHTEQAQEYIRSKRGADTPKAGAPSQSSNVWCRSWSRRGGWLPPAWTGGVSRPMSCPASAYPGPSTPERSSLRSTRSFGSGAACTASSG